MNWRSKLAVALRAKLGFNGETFPLNSKDTLYKAKGGRVICSTKRQIPMVIFTSLISVLSLFIMGMKGSSQPSSSITSDIMKEPGEELTIVIDPGHGGPFNGAVCEYQGVQTYEKDLNFSIAKFIETELEGYTTKSGKKVRVILTHQNEEDSPSSLKERIQIAIDNNADLFLSLHNNVSSDGSREFKGSMVLVTNSQYTPEDSKYGSLYSVEEDLSNLILKELQGIGLTLSGDVIDKENATLTQGLLRRVSTGDSEYPNGDITDWYGVIRYGVDAGVPSILVEHAYMDNEEDFHTFLNTDDKLRKIALADTEALVKFFNLSKKES